MNTKKLLLLLTTSLVLGISLICKDPQPVQAKCRSWDLTCTKPIRIPPISIPLPSVGSTNSESCLGVVADSKYNFLITNATSGVVAFSINDKTYILWANDHQRFTFQKASGSGCDIQYFPTPIVRFSRASGGLRDVPVSSGNYQFEEIGGETFLSPSSK
jgi:hypothetical protein